MDSKIFIDVKIPFEPGKKLGYAINRAMNTVDGWVLILDHDVFLSLNPLWYQICQAAIEAVGYDAGWITCSTNAIGCPLQKADFSIKQMEFLFNKKFDSSNMNDHFALAQEIYREHQGEVINITAEARRHKLSGLFVLTHRNVYDRVKHMFGIPDNKFLGWDNYYNDRVIELGHQIYLMKDLYVYHGYKRLWKNGVWGEKMNEGTRVREDEKEKDTRVRGDGKDKIQENDSTKLTLGQVKARMVVLNDNVETADAIMKEWHDIATEHDIKYVLACGTCLGFVRDGGYCDGDDDIDIVIHPEDMDRTIEIMKAHGFQLGRTGGSQHFMKNNVLFDVWTKPVFKEPYGKVLYKGLMYSVPANVTHYLAVLYGDWKIPYKISAKEAVCRNYREEVRGDGKIRKDTTIREYEKK